MLRRARSISFSSGHDRLAVEERVLGRQGTDRLREARQLSREVGAMTTPFPDAVAFLSGDQPVYAAWRWSSSADGALSD